MKNKVYKQIEITGISENSLEEAINGAVNRAAETIEHLRWFEVTEIRGNIEKGAVDCFQVTLKAGFALESGK